MDRGEYVKGEITITPTMNGSYLVRRNWFGPENQYSACVTNEMACFTNYADLLAFLNEEYRVANIPMTGNSNPGDEK